MDDQREVRRLLLDVRKDILKALELMDEDVNPNTNAQIGNKGILKMLNQII